MRNLNGLEMVCFCRSTHFELSYANGQYSNPAGEVIDDVLDMGCYVCSTAYYTRSGDAIAYCPNCANIDRKKFTTREDLVDYMRGHDMSWLQRNSLKAVAVESFDGEWKMRFTRDPMQLEAMGQFKMVRIMDL